MVSKENLVLWQERMFFLCIFLLPFYFIPSKVEFLPIVQISHRAIIYPLLIGIIFWLINLKVHKEQKVEKYILMYFLIFLCWSIITSVIGIYKFPYREDINIEPYKQLSSALNFWFNEYFRSVKAFEYFYSDEFVRECYMYVVAVIGQTYFICYALASLWVYSLFKDRFKEGIILIQKAVIFSFIYLIPIGIIEFMSIHGNLWAKNWLRQIFYMVYYGQICRNNGWWPPAQMDTPQIRLLWPEPSHIAEYIIILLPSLIVWFLFKQKKATKIFSLIFMAILTVLSIYTASRTVYVVYIGIFLTTVALLLIKMDKKYIISYLSIIIISISLVSLKAYLDYKSERTPKSLSEISNNNRLSLSETFFSIPDKDHARNIARLSYMISYWKTALQNPIFGVGFTFVYAYYKDNCPEFAKEEFKSLLNQHKDKKELIFPSPVTFLLHRLAEIGFIGMILFFMPIFMLVFFFRKQIISLNFWRFGITEEVFFYILGLISCLLIMCVNLYQPFEYYLIFVSFAFILIEEKKQVEASLRK